jgi:pimeloyl-ACP methyl ester carboxylesterase
MPDMSEIWKGYERLNFTFNNRSSILVKPKTPLKGNPWIWRAEFFDAFPSADMAMLEKGYYLVYHCVSNMYGCPSSVELMHEFYLYVKDKYKLSPKTVIFGFSRGGLYAVNFAAKYPSCVNVLYLDAPVMDIKSWPGGKGSGKCSPHEWEECLNCYGLNEETVKNFKENPIDKAEYIAEQKIPVIIVAGDSDELVPYDENGRLFAEAYKKKGDSIKIILKPGIGHHPHSLEDPAPIVDFILSF